MKLQLTLALRALEEQRLIARSRYKPLLFVITPSILGAEAAKKMMTDEFGLKPLLVVDDDEYEKAELRSAAANLGSPSSEYDSVVSVYMLREGWDVPEVSVLCLLRGFGSPLFAHQVLGRGLRLVRRNGLEKDEEVQRLIVVDHPALNMDFLWKDIDALVKEGGVVVREPTSGENTGGDEGSEDSEQQRVVRPELLALLRCPSPSEQGAVSKERAMELLAQSLECLRDLAPQERLVYVTASASAIDVLGSNMPKSTNIQSTFVSALESPMQHRESAQKEFTAALMDWSRDICDDIDALRFMETPVYCEIVVKFEAYMFDHASVTDVEPNVLFAALSVVKQARELVFFEVRRRVLLEEESNG